MEPEPEFVQETGGTGKTLLISFCFCHKGAKTEGAQSFFAFYRCFMCVVYSVAGRRQNNSAGRRTPRTARLCKKSNFVLLFATKAQRQEGHKVFLLFTDALCVLFIPLPEATQ